MNLLDLVTGGEPIPVHTTDDVTVSADDSFLLAIGLLIAGIILTIIIFFLIKSYA